MKKIEQPLLPNFLKSVAESEQKDIDTIGYISHEYVKVARRVCKNPAWDRYRLGLQKFLSRQR